jgi:cyclase
VHRFPAWLLHVFAMVLVTAPFPARAAGFPELELVPLRSGLYKFVSTTSTAVNGVISVGEDGILLVDTGRRATADRLAAVLDSLGAGAGPQRIVINTHHHLDHTGGNAAVGAGALIIAHKNVPARMTTGDAVLYDLPAAAIPRLLVHDALTLRFNGDEVRIIHVPGAHTDGDLVVWFRRARVACLGDLLVSDSFPSVDLTSGGTVVGYGLGLQTLLDRLPDGTRLIAGHGRDYSLGELRDLLAMVEDSAAAVRHAWQAHVTLEELDPAQVLAPWLRWSSPYVSTRDWASTVHRALSGEGEHVRPSVLEPVVAALRRGGAAAALREYRHLKDAQPHLWDFSESKLNLLGYHLLSEGRIDDAVLVFEENAAAFPTSANVHDSLGEACLAQGDTLRATANYRTSLELDPLNANAAAVLERLEGRRSR